MRGDAPDAVNALIRGEGRSPHARGCTGTGAVGKTWQTPFPACAGMHRRTWPQRRADCSRSPHARGCTGPDERGPTRLLPFPACAGMHRTRSSRRSPSFPVPRMRGDAPASSSRPSSSRNRSPHARGCTVIPIRPINQASPFPACAGMHRARDRGSGLFDPVPRMRGDAPAVAIVESYIVIRSPHARGCTAHRRCNDRRRPPFPACAGMHR